MIRSAAIVASIALLAPIPALAADSISKVNGSISAEGGREYNELSTVNGSISIGGGAVVDNADTVNGSINIGPQAAVGDAETVNGKIDLDAGARIEGDASTVNGAIRLEAGSEVAGRVETVNGTIRLDRAQIGGGIETVSGSILVGADSVVRGGILVEKPNGGWFSNWGKQKMPRVEIGANAVVEGELRFDREVELIVHPSAKIGPVVGEAAADIEIKRS